MEVVEISPLPQMKIMVCCLVIFSAVSSSQQLRICKMGALGLPLPNCQSENGREIANESALMGSEGGGAEFLPLPLYFAPEDFPPGMY